MSTSSKHVLGISCFYHDSAAALVRDGELIAAAQEERFTRKKHDEGFPVNSIGYCLKTAGVDINDVAAVVFYDKPLLKLERLLIGFIRSWPFEYRTFLSAMDSWLGEKIWIKPLIQKKLGYRGPVYFCEHHMSHAASSFFVSPFKRAAVLTVDGVGEWATASLGRGNDNRIELLKEIEYPNSLGLLYTALTYFLGFEPNDGEYKVMGLAPYGKPVYRKQLKELFTVFTDGSFTLRPGIFHGNYVWSEIGKELEDLFCFPIRNPEDPLEQHHKDLAASLQELTGEVMVGLAKKAKEETGEDNLCLSGGVALNCVANSKIFRQAGFKDIFIQPAAGDAGGAIGAAYFLWHQIWEKPRNFVMRHSFWGPGFTDQEIKKFLDAKGISYQYMETETLLVRVVQLINEQKIVGWFQGRMEWGPRALGNRSILADARNSENWQKVNLKIKFRESFRPFAPAVLYERSGNYFDRTEESPFMLFTAEVKTDKIPAVTHVDGTARLQTVNRDSNPLFRRLLEVFEDKTGCPVLINTSFNIRGEPIVCTPEDAWGTFIKTGLDFLVLGNYYIIDKGKL